MANPLRILFVSDEVAPFTSSSVIANLVRTLPEQLQESGEYEVRIMTPRYGIISERRNRLHEVIRLSGTGVRMGSHMETLKVKVASIPGIRLQVYFMDNNTYFKRKGIYKDKSSKVFEDNPARALFFGRAALATIRNLGWTPDVVHAFGAMSSFVPLLLRTELNAAEGFENTRVVFTPSATDLGAPLTAAMVKSIGLPEDERLFGRTATEAGTDFADAVLYPPDAAPDLDGAFRFGKEGEEMMKDATVVYEQVLSAVAV